MAHQKHGLSASAKSTHAQSILAQMAEVRTNPR
jgi:hypothetical protein